MRIQFYKPNAKVTGSACSFWLSDDGSIMSSLIKQDSWNDKLKRGSFSKNKDNPAKKVIIKLNLTEAGAIVDSLEKNRKWSGYHQSSKQVTKINFGPYERNGDQIGYSYSVNKEDKEDSTNKTSFIIGFTFGEGVVLREALIEAIKSSVFSEQGQPQQAKQSYAKKEAVQEQGNSNLSMEKDILDDEDMW